MSGNYLSFKTCWFTTLPLSVKDGRPEGDFGVKGKWPWQKSGWIFPSMDRQIVL